MHKKFDHEGIEKKWQARWKESDLYAAHQRDPQKEKEYVLVEWPYPSGNLHMGHWFAFAVVDIYVRARRMQGKQVLFPMGFDAFGLPAENAAIKHGKDPKEWTESNIAHMKKQLESMGNAFSWDKTTSSTDPEYYKWTQWMFTKFFEEGIAYRGRGIVNWCPGCHTVIANEQVQSDGTCERSGDVIERREMPQWMLRITQFADALIDDLDTLTEWPDYIKEAQRQWIGRSRGVEIDFALPTGDTLTAFTTRPDTLFGVTYLVLAPEHEWVLAHKDDIKNWKEVEAYITETSHKDEITRTKVNKDKTGVRLEGITATNPANGEEIPVFIADYVLKGYGTGVIMAVPAHDERDFAFATKFNIPARKAIAPIFNRKPNIRGYRTSVYALLTNEKGEYLLQHFKKRNYYWLPGGAVHNGELELDCLKREVKEETGFTQLEEVTEFTSFYYDFISRTDDNTRNKMIVYTARVQTEDRGELSLSEYERNEDLELMWVNEERMEALLQDGEPTRSEIIRYILKQKDVSVDLEHGAVINSGELDGMGSEDAKEAITEKVGGRFTNTYRLRDWSVGRQRYWGTPIPIVYDPDGKPHAIPEEHLPWHLPTDVDFTPTGEAPLAKSVELRERVERIFGKGWTPEVETMDTFVDSSWYYLRYLDPQNDTSFCSPEMQNAWMPVDVYFGGSEHTTMHLLYSRFWHKALHSLGLVHSLEPYKKRLSRGLVLGPDGNKMSKSKGNVLDPDEQVRLLGADTVKMFLAFMGPYGEPSNYPWDFGGVAGLRRFLERVYGLQGHIIPEETEETARQLHKTIAKVTKDIDEYKFNTAISALMVFLNHAEKAGLSSETYTTFLRMLAPFAPHLTEELWETQGETGSIHNASWPIVKNELLADDVVKVSVQINGKMRGIVEVGADALEKEVLQAVYDVPALKARIEGEPKRIIYVPNKIINIIA